MLSPSTDALRMGKALSAFTVALTMNGMYVSLTPLRSWYGCLYFWRRCAARDMSISKTVVTWAEIRLDMTMCAAVFLRIGGIGAISTRSPGWYEGTKGVAGAAAALAAGFAAGAPASAGRAGEGVLAAGGAAAAGARDGEGAAGAGTEGVDGVEDHVGVGLRSGGTLGALG